MSRRRPDRFATRAYDPQALRFPGNAPAISGEAFAGDIEVDLPSRRLAPMKINSRTIAVTMTIEDAQALEWLARHLGFEDALRETPPHLGKDVRTERAYNMMHAIARLEEQLRTAGARGDAWMYSEESKS